MTQSHDRLRRSSSPACQSKAAGRLTTAQHDVGSQTGDTVHKFEPILKRSCYTHTAPFSHRGFQQLLDPEKLDTSVLLTSFPGPIVSSGLVGSEALGCNSFRRNTLLYQPRFHGFSSRL